MNPGIHDVPDVRHKYQDVRHYQNTKHRLFYLLSMKREDHLHDYI